MPCTFRDENNKWLILLIVLSIPTMVIALCIGGDKLKKFLRYITKCTGLDMDDVYVLFNVLLWLLLCIGTVCLCVFRYAVAG